MYAGVKKKFPDSFGFPLYLYFYSKTRPDTRLPKSRAGGQGPFLSPQDHLGRGSEVKE